MAVKDKVTGRDSPIIINEMIKSRQPLKTSFKSSEKAFKQREQTPLSQPLC